MAGVDGRLFREVVISAVSTLRIEIPACSQRASAASEILDLLQ
jgi:hypothetical protein